MEDTIMKLFKKIALVFTAAAMALSLAACSGAKTSSGASDDSGAAGSGSFRTDDEIKSS